MEDGDLERLAHAVNRDQHARRTIAGVVRRLSVSPYARQEVERDVCNMFADTCCRSRPPDPTAPWARTIAKQAAQRVSNASKLVPLHDLVQLPAPPANADVDEIEETEKLRARLKQLLPVLRGVLTEYQFNLVVNSPNYNTLKDFARALRTTPQKIERRFAEIRKKARLFL